MFRCAYGQGSVMLSVLPFAYAKSFCFHFLPFLIVLLQVLSFLGAWPCHGCHPGRAAMNQNKCVHCGNPFEPNPRLKKQDYCRGKECQLARKRKWQKERLRTDPDYKANQLDCQQRWHERHPGYYKRYRERNRQSAERNRLMQRYRNSRRPTQKVIAKMDAFESSPSGRPGLFYLLPVIAKMDALTQKFIIIPAN